jgi:AraC family ethanolamine operon transcriptional activator
MCLAAHVSERRLRSAFYNTFDMPPSEFFRARMLSRARARLHAGEQGVTRVALDLGFNHLGRFARQYADLYDERPSDTLAIAQTHFDPQAHRLNVAPA